MSRRMTTRCNKLKALFNQPVMLMYRPKPWGSQRAQDVFVVNQNSSSSLNTLRRVIPQVMSIIKYMIFGNNYNNYGVLYRIYVNDMVFHLPSCQIFQPLINTTISGLVV